MSDRKITAVKNWTMEGQIKISKEIKKREFALSILFSENYLKNEFSSYLESSENPLDYSFNKFKGFHLVFQKG